MKFFTRIAVLFYVTFVMFISAIMILHVFNYFGKVNFGDIQTVLYVYWIDKKSRLLLFIISLALLFLNYIFYKMFTVNYHREKIIAFDNPSGRVSVSLTALEDLIKRKLFKMTEINEIKPSIFATKKGLQVKLRVVFGSEINIPETTSKIQEMVKRKVQDTIGLDESVTVSIYVGKIIPMQVKDKAEEKKLDEPPSSEPNIPFRGYRV